MLDVIARLTDSSVSESDCEGLDAINEQTRVGTALMKKDVPVAPEMCAEVVWGKIAQVIVMRHNGVQHRSSPVSGAYLSLIAKTHWTCPVSFSFIEQSIRSHTEMRLRRAKLSHRWRARALLSFHLS
jgi:hypothetical protein